MEETALVCYSLDSCFGNLDNYNILQILMNVQLWSIVAQRMLGVETWKAASIASVIVDSQEMEGTAQVCTQSSSTLVS